MVQATTEVTYGDQKVQVLQGGYYDRYRMNPDLDEVQKDPGVVKDLSFLRSIPKKEVESRVGRTWSPNYYYRTFNVQLILLAPIKNLREKVPAALEPLNPFPGYGLVAVTFYRYDVCDVDPYNEVSIAVVCRPPGARGPHLWNLIQSVRQRRFYGYVLALPVTTDLARVRGVYGYQLPKWLMDIDISFEGNAIQIKTQDKDDKKQDISFEAPLPAVKRSGNASSATTTSVSLNKVDGKWHQIAVQLNPITAVQQLLPRNAKLTLGKGPLSDLVKELGASFVVRMDTVTEAQMALHLPEPTNAFDEREKLNKKTV